MVRRLDDTRVGEYKANWGYNFVYTILILAGVVGLFLLPVCVFKDGDIINAYSPVNYLFKNGFEDMQGFTSIAYIALFSWLFINSFFTLSINKLSKSVWIKIAKIFELLLVLGCLTVHSFYLVGNECAILETLKYYLCWLPIHISLVIFSLVNYFRAKKITIYD